MRSKLTALVAALATVFGVLTGVAPAQAIDGASVSFTVLQEGIPETARVRNVVDGQNQWQPYGTTRHNIDKTCPANSNYKLQVPGAGGTRLLQPGQCKTWTSVGPRVVGVFREDYTPPPPPPDESEWPDATNSGFRGNPDLLVERDSWRVTTPGAVIENVRVDASDGGLIIDAPNVTIRNSVVDAGIWGIDALHTADNMVIEDTTVIGGLQAGIGIDHSDGWLVQRVDLYGGNDGIKPGGSGTVRDSWIHDLGQIGNDPHNDAMQFGNARGILIDHNRMECRDTSCIAMFDGQATFNNVTIEDNWMGGAGYLIYAGGSSSTNIKILRNTMGSYGYQHPVTDWVNRPGNEFTGNVYTNGQPVPVP